MPAAPRACTPAEAQIATADVAVEPTSWEELYRQFRRYGHCDDGVIAERFSDAIVRMLATRWWGLPDLVPLLRHDRLFADFVLRHIDATADEDDLMLAAEQARGACPTDAEKWCRRMASAARRALTELHALPPAGR